MTDIATLKIEVQADGVAKVTGDLNKLAGAGDKASKEAGRTGKAFAGLGSTMSKTAASIAKMVSIGAVTAALGKATEMAIAFENAMAEVSTLTDSMDMSHLTEEVEKLSTQFGSDTVGQAKALYQVISAGASTATEAVETLTVANKLAVGGVTDVQTAADGLTSILNAYGLAATEAEGVSDSMFVAMKAGKTTIGELSQSVGQLAPIASQAGVSIDQMMAATAALTKTGLSTRMAMTGLRQVMVSVLKPTSEATEIAEKLGLTFDAASLSDFPDFLKRVQAATGGNIEVMAKLFGSVEALGAMLSLTSGSGAQDFLNILSDMDKKAGETQAAFDKMSETASFLRSVLTEQLKGAFLNVGQSMLTGVIPALQFTITHFDQFMETLKTVGKIILTGAIAKGIASLPAMLALVAQGAKAAALGMRALTLAIMANPFAALLKVLIVAGSALYAFKDNMVTVGKTTASVGKFVSATWEVVSKKLSGVFTGIGKIWDGVLAKFKTSNKDMAKGFSQLGDFILAGFKAVVNGVIRFFDVLGKAIGIIIGHLSASWKKYWDYTLKLFKSGLAGIKKMFSGDFGFDEFKSQLEENMTEPALDLGEQLIEMWNVAAGTDYIGEVVDSFGEFADEVEAVAGEVSHTNDELQEIVVTAQRLTPALDNNAAGAANAANALAMMASETDKAKEKLTPFQEALSDTASRIDSAFKDVWRNIGGGFGDFATDLKGAFFDLMAELAHIAITRPIVVAITGAFTGALGSAGAAASGLTGAAGSGGGPVAGVTSLLTSGFTGLGELYQKAGIFLRDMGLEGAGNASFNTGLDYANQGVGANLASAGLNIGAGLVGNYLGGKVFGGGGYSNVGGAVGGAVGSIYGPLGTAAGSFIGSGIGSLFGGDNNGNNRGMSDFNLADRTNDARGIGKSFEQENVDASRSLVDELQKFADLIGGSNFAGNVTVGNNDGIRFGGEKFGEDTEAFFAVALKEVALASENLVGYLRPVVRAFEGTSEELQTLVFSVISLGQAVENNPAEQAILDFAAATESASNTFFQSYQKQFDATFKLVEEFDGSTESTIALAQNLALTQEAAYELALGILTLQDSMDKLFANSAQSIRDSILTEEQLAKARIERLAALDKELLTLVDPEQINQTAAEIERLNRAIFESLSDEQQKVQAEAFAQHAESTNAIVQEKLTTLLDNHVASGNQLNMDTERVMRAASRDMQEAADTFLEAARIQAANNRTRATTTLAGGEVD